MNKILLIFCLAYLATSCDSTKNEPAESNFISVRSLIEAQIAHVDTSLYSIMKISFVDTSRYDTTYIKREEFREAAKDFLTIPDLADPKIARDYREEPAQYDETMNRVIITYIPVDIEKAEVKKQELLVTPAPATGDKVSNIMILREISTRDSFMKQDMLWILDKSFQISTTRQKEGTPEITTVTRVIWNKDPDE